MKFVKSEAEVMKFRNEDVIRTSGGTGSDVNPPAKECGKGAIKNK